MNQVGEPGDGKLCHVGLQPSAPWGMKLPSPNRNSMPVMIEKLDWVNRMCNRSYESAN